MSTDTHKAKMARKKALRERRDADLFRDRKAAVKVSHSSIRQYNAGAAPRKTFSALSVLAALTLLS